MGKYEIEEINKTSNGTEIKLYLKDTEIEFLNSWKLKHIIKKYSDHINFPILMKKELTEKEKSKDKNIIEVLEDEIINKANALWIKSKQDIEEKEYKEFYKHISYDIEEPLSWIHNKVEGVLEYTSLLIYTTKSTF